MALSGFPAFDCSSMFSSALSCANANHGPYHRHCSCSIHVLSSFQKSRRGRSTQLRIPKASRSAGSGGCLSLSGAAAAAAKDTVAKSSGAGNCSTMKVNCGEFCQVDQALSKVVAQTGDEHIFESLSYLAEMYSVVVVGDEEHYAEDYPQ